MIGNIITALIVLLAIFAVSIGIYFKIKHKCGCSGSCNNCTSGSSCCNGKHNRDKNQK